MSSEEPTSAPARCRASEEPARTVPPQSGRPPRSHAGLDCRRPSSSRCSPSAASCSSAGCSVASGTCSSSSWCRSSWRSPSSRRSTCSRGEGCVAALSTGTGVPRAPARRRRVLAGVRLAHGQPGREPGGERSRLRRGHDSRGPTRRSGWSCPSATSSAASPDPALESYLESAANNAVGLGTTVVGSIFSLFSVALFTFYLSAQGPAFRRAVTSLFPPTSRVRSCGRGRSPSPRPAATSTRAR